jgi:MFS family permease
MLPASNANPATLPVDRRGLTALEWLNFFLADVQTGLGPFLAAYLAASGWNPERVGLTLTLGGVVTVVLQTPAGAIVDGSRRKRMVIALGTAALVAGAILFFASTRVMWVCVAQSLVGAAGPFLGPTVAAITLGMVGARGFSRQFGRNQSFNAAGNVITALLVAVVGHRFGIRWIFAVPVALAIPTFLALAAIPAKRIDYARSRGAETEEDGAAGKQAVHVSAVSAVFADRVLLAFFICACLFHLANAAMLPQLGELLSRQQVRNAAAFMSACIIVTQLVITCTAPLIAKLAARIGRRPLLLAGFGVLPVRGVLYTMAHGVAPLIAIQIFDGIANAIFGVVSILVIADRTAGTGRFNLMQGALATVVGIGAAFSTTVGGTLIQHASYRVSFLGLAGIALLAVALLWIAVPETLHSAQQAAGERRAA